MILRAGTYVFTFPRRALVMGVMNITPDSFSDGGKLMDAGAAVEWGHRLVAEGADMLDVGGESTRPGAEVVGVEEEKRRILPVIRRMVSELRVPISVDTMKWEVAEAAIGEGVSVVNDVNAGGNGEKMWGMVGRLGVGYVCMHMQGRPGTMQENPRYGDVVGEVNAFFGEQLDRLGACGVGREHVIVDPGFGFGKSLDHNLEMLAGVKTFLGWERPVLVGVSRKSMVGQVTGVKEPVKRVAGSLAGAVWAVGEGAQMVRVHDVRETCEALRMLEAIKLRRH